MAFDLGRFFQDIFMPSRDEVVTILIDVPHGEVKDNPAWADRRALAEAWRQELVSLAPRWNLTVNPMATYLATGANNSDLPEACRLGTEAAVLKDVVNHSTIVLAMTEFSATAPLYGLSRAHTRLRVGSMPGLARFMQDSGLSADYGQVAQRCQVLVGLFNAAVAADVTFSTGHRCHFDIPAPSEPDDGILHPEKAGTEASLSNLPAGEVYTVPNEKPDSQTAGELPMMVGEALAVLEVAHNRVVKVRGEGEAIDALRRRFQQDPAWCNIAEFAIGVNDRARVTGVVLEDEKAGFHWAWGRSDHLGGTVGVKQFLSPGNVVHQDVVYAKESPIQCARLELIFPEGRRQTLIVDGVLQV